MRESETHAGQASTNMRMFLRWSARVAQLLFNQASQISHLLADWLYAATTNNDWQFLPATLRHFLYILLVTCRAREQ